MPNTQTIGHGYYNPRALPKQPRKVFEYSRQPITRVAQKEPCEDKGLVRSLKNTVHKHSSGALIGHGTVKHSQYRAMHSDRRSPQQARAKEGVEQKFARLAEIWRSDTYYSSVVYEIAMHRAYQQIIGMGHKAVPFILRELELRGGHWFWALNAITGEDPTRPNATYEDAVQDWLSWGREKGSI